MYRWVRGRAWKENTKSDRPLSAVESAIARELHMAERDYLRAKGE